MGIVAFCPNGHRIKVKDKLAGKKGICPHCDARFRIPLKDAASAAGPPLARIVSLDALYAASLPRALAVGAEAAVEAVATADEPVAEGHVAFHPAIADQPGLAWCLALPGGEPSPPWTAEQVQAWLDQGGPTGEELLWRADWPGWVSVREVFPEHVPQPRSRRSRWDGIP